MGAKTITSAAGPGAAHDGFVMFDGSEQGARITVAAEAIEAESTRRAPWSGPRSAWSFRR